MLHRIKNKLNFLGRIFFVSVLLFLIFFMPSSGSSSSTGAGHYFSRIKTGDLVYELNNIIGAYPSANIEIGIMRTVTLSENLTLPENVTLKFYRDGYLAFGGFNLTVNGKILNPDDHEIFDTTSAGKVIFNRNTTVKPSWWFKNPIACNDEERFMLAIDSLNYGGVIWIDTNYVFYTEPCTISDSNITIYGVGPNSRIVGAPNEHCFEFDANNIIHNFIFDGLQIISHDTTPVGDAIHINQYDPNKSEHSSITVRNCYIRHFYSACWLQGVKTFQFNNNSVNSYYSGHGIMTGNVKANKNLLITDNNFTFGIHGLLLNSDNDDVIVMSNVFDSFTDSSIYLSDCNNVIIKDNIFQDTYNKNTPQCVEIDSGNNIVIQNNVYTLADIPIFITCTNCFNLTGFNSNDAGFTHFLDYDGDEIVTIENNKGLGIKNSDPSYELDIDEGIIKAYSWLDLDMDTNEIVDLSSECGLTIGAYGTVQIDALSTNSNAIYKIGYTELAISATSIFSNVIGTAGKFNFDYNAGTQHYWLENKYGDNQKVKVQFIISGEDL